MNKVIFVSDLFAEDYIGGAELTLQALIEGCYFSYDKVRSSSLTLNFIEKNIDCFWVFGNISQIHEDLLFYISKNLKNRYYAIEFDYKYCKHRLPQLHSRHEEGYCNCENTKRGKLYSFFFYNAKAIWWMSKAQKEFYEKKFPLLNKKSDSFILSSIFSKSQLDILDSLRSSEKSNDYLIQESQSWVKGTDQSVKHADEKGLSYKKVGGLSYKQFLDELAGSKGLIFLPNGFDTCPRVCMEAKILGCELILNENVQNLNEPWFNTSESILAHIQERKEFFQNKLWREFYKVDMQEKTHFKIVLPCYNVAETIAETIKSIKNQNYTNWECAIVDDVSSDNTSDVIQREIRGDDRFIFIKNKIRSWPCYNRKLAIESFEKIEDEDVIVSIGGDDKLMHKFSLERINFEYTTKEVMSTFGTWVDQNFNRSRVYNKDYSQHVKENSLYRSAPWIASAPRTYKYKLFKQIREEDFKNDNGEYWKYATDFAVFIPILEMCGEHTSYIPEILYVYNLDNPLNMHKVAPNKQIENEHKIRNRTSYSLADIDT